MDVGLECGFEGVCVVVLVVGFDVVFEIRMEVGLGVGLVDVVDWTTSDLSVFSESADISSNAIASTCTQSRRLLHVFWRWIPVGWVWSSPPPEITPL